MMAKLAWFCLVLACTAYWVTNIRVPEGFDNPWLFRFLAAVYGVIKSISGLQEYIYDPADVFVRTMRGSSTPPPSPEYIVNLDRIEDGEFNGVKIRLYVPKGLQMSQNPGVVFYHGGGWATGSIETHDAVCQLLADGIQAVIVSVEYRLAPEHPYPAGFDDCVTATTYFIQHAEQFGVDPNRVAVAGDSSGGNLAAAVSLRLRDINFQPQPKLQVLIYPPLQALDLNTPSYQKYKNDFALPAHTMALLWTMYATGQSKYYEDVTANKHTSPEVKHKALKNNLQHDVILQSYSSEGYIKPNLDIVIGKENIWNELQTVLMDPYFAPLMAKDLGNLPEAIVFTAEQDILRDDGIWYVNKMKDASIEVTHIHYKAGFHGILSMNMNQKNFIEAREMLYSAIKSKL